MKEDELLDIWTNYALIVRLPYREIEKLKDYCKENKIVIIFDKPSPYHLIVKEIVPSGNIKDEEGE